MVGLGLKILGIGLAGSALSYGAYLGIEDMKWKASTDYPAYYWNRNYRTVYSDQTDEDNAFLKYGEETKWKVLYANKYSKNNGYNKDKSELDKLDLKEDWQKYRHWCSAYLRKFVMNSEGDKNIINNHCVFDYSLRKYLSSK